MLVYSVRFSDFLTKLLPFILIGYLVNSQGWLFSTDIGVMEYLILDLNTWSETRPKPISSLANPKSSILNEFIITLRSIVNLMVFWIFILMSNDIYTRTGLHVSLHVCVYKLTHVKCFLLCTCYYLVVSIERESLIVIVVYLKLSLFTISNITSYKLSFMTSQ